MNTEQQKKEIKVTLGLLNGDAKEGDLIRFYPQTQHLPLQVGPDEMEYFDAPQIAYVGFHRREGSYTPMPNPGTLEEIIVNTVTGNKFRVQMTRNRPHENGFFAFTDNKESPFERFFFYNHGVRNLEHPKPIGQTLVDNKVIPPNGMKKALDTQKILHKQQLGDLLITQRRVEALDVEKALAQQSKKPLKIGELLVEAGLITEQDLQQALAEQAKNRNMKVGEILIKMGLVSEDELVSSLAKKFNLPFINLDDYVLNPELIEQFDINLLMRFQVLPVTSSEDTLTVASPDPINFDAFDAIRFQTNKRITEVLATPTQIQKALETGVSMQAGNSDEWLSIERISDNKEDESENEVLEVKAAEAPPIVRLVNKILINGLHKGASDIHILPQARELLLLYRINGELQQEMVLEKWVQRRMISRIKLLSGMNIAEHRVTQDGRMLVRHEDKTVEFRVSCIPNAYGESLVMRILGKEMATDLQTLGLSEKDRRSLAQMIRKPFGLILATGPTGSGKSTTLFALIQSIIKLPLHIITIEDPVESEIRGANQVQINTKVGLSFASVLRNVLRHDPDVIMVGEMRDEETTSIGIEAALTGHLMFSTLHTNSAVDTVIRLLDLGVPNYLLAPALRGVISQNLVKRLCEHCHRPLDSEEDEIYTLLQDMQLERPETLYQPGECEHCNHSGFSGRIMVYEFLEITEPVRHAIHNGMIGDELLKIAESEGMVCKAKHALSLAESGVICRDDLMKLLV